MANEKRNTHSYKCTDAVYKAAIKRAKKQKLPLATMLEQIVASFAFGEDTVEIRDGENINSKKKK